MTINYYKRQVYGNTTYYVEGEHYGPIATLTKKKTIDLSDMEALKSMGFTLSEVMDPK